MKRELLILDLTEMSGQNVCIAGIDLKSHEQVRLASPSPTRTTVRSLSQLRPGDVLSVDYEFERKRVRPQAEDARWNRLTARKVRTMPYAEVRALLRPSTFNGVEDAFGEPSVKGARGNHAWQPRRGTRSLGSVAVTYVGVDQDGARKPRIDLVDGEGKHWHGIPLQDLQAKIHPDECESCEAAHLSNLRIDFAVPGPAIVRVGLTRPFASDAGSAPGCWLQVTNVFARERTHFV
ncbi:MAG: hypothetical protein M3P30_12880 [Chloroflexota bacterium]|nr:hypothetical protein [Chloroflexota bacterium]